MGERMDENEETLPVSTVEVVSGIDASKLTELIHELKSKPSAESIDSKIQALRDDVLQRVDRVDQRVTELESDLQSKANREEAADADSISNALAQSSQTQQDLSDLRGEIGSIRDSLPQYDAAESRVQTLVEDSLARSLDDANGKVGALASRVATLEQSEPSQFEPRIASLEDAIQNQHHDDDEHSESTTILEPRLHEGASSALFGDDPAGEVPSPSSTNQAIKGLQHHVEDLKRKVQDTAPQRTAERVDALEKQLGSLAHAPADSSPATPTGSNTTEQQAMSTQLDPAYGRGVDEVQAKAEALRQQLDEHSAKVDQALRRKADQKDVEHLQDELLNYAPRSTPRAGDDDPDAAASADVEIDDSENGVAKRLGALEGKHSKLRRAHDDLSDQLDKLKARHQTQFQNTSRALDDLSRQLQERTSQSSEANEQDVLNAIELVAFMCSSMAVGKAWKDPTSSELQIGSDGLIETTSDAVNEVAAPGYSTARKKVLAHVPSLLSGDDNLSGKLGRDSALRNVAQLVQDGDLEQKAGIRQGSAEVEKRLKQVEDALSGINSEGKDPAQLTRDMKQLRNKLKRLENSQLPSGEQRASSGQLHDGEQAILAGKPVMGYRCMGCDQPLDGRLSDDPGQWTAAPGLPYPDKQQPGSPTPQQTGNLQNVRSRPGTMQSGAPSGPHLPPGGYRSSVLAQYSQGTRPASSSGVQQMKHRSLSS
jgi:Skp family chaperone for outer membrane proteins